MPALRSSSDRAFLAAGCHVHRKLTQPSHVHNGMSCGSIAPSKATHPATTCSTSLCALQSGVELVAAELQYPASEAHPIAFRAAGCNVQQKLPGPDQVCVPLCFARDIIPSRETVFALPNQGCTVDKCFREYTGGGDKGFSASVPCSRVPTTPSRFSVVPVIFSHFTALGACRVPGMLF